MSESFFLAVLPDPTTATRLARRTAASCLKYNFSSRPISPERFHISLLGFGDYDPKLAEAVTRIAGTIQALPFEVRFDRALSFKSAKKSPFVLTGEESLAKLREFAGQVSAAFGVKLSSFTPHLTLIWDDKRIEPHEIQPVGWIVREFTLIRSFVGKSRYEILGRWPLESVRL